MNIENFNLNYIYNDYNLDFIKREVAEWILHKIYLCKKLHLSYINVSIYVYKYDDKILIIITDYYLGDNIYIDSHEESIDILNEISSDYNNFKQTFEYELSILNNFLNRIETLNKHDISKKYGLR